VRLAPLLRVLAALAVLGATILVLVRSGTSLAQIAHFASPPVHLLVLAILTLDLLCRGARMVLLASTLGYDVPARTAVVAQLAGEAAAALTPARAGSDAGRMLVLSNAGVRISAGGAIVVAEMIFEVAALLLVAGGLMVAIPPTRSALPAVALYVAVVLVTSLGAVLLAARAAKRPGRRLPWLPLSPSHVVRLRETAVAFAAACASLGRLGPARIAAILTISAVHILARLAILPVLLAAADRAIPVGTTVAACLLLMYGGALVPAPGGGGVIEFAFAMTLEGAIGPTVGAALVWWRWYTFHLLAGAGGLLLARAAWTRRRPHAASANAVGEVLTGA
jgi:uncharacterized protein (TIRG00374 family)